MTEYKKSAPKFVYENDKYKHDTVEQILGYVIHHLTCLRKESFASSILKEMTSDMIDSLLQAWDLVPDDDFIPKEGDFWYRCEFCLKSSRKYVCRSESQTGKADAINA